MVAKYVEKMMKGDSAGSTPAKSAITVNRLVREGF
jgi:hypothetical protein